ncbi:hypothetical protein, partial [Holdemanella biformis]|uniref:hypothetical protein n=1 Tax=Holdemanella biformis TaxID=1735 RepID=UPI0022E5268A
SYKIGIFKNSRYHPFNSEGSQLLHPVALLIINVQCENNMNSKHVVANDLILSKSIYFHRIR